MQWPKQRTANALAKTEDNSTAFIAESTCRSQKSVELLLGRGNKFATRCQSHTSLPTTSSLALGFDLNAAEVTESAEKLESGTLHSPPQSFFCYTHNLFNHMQIFSKLIRSWLDWFWTLTLSVLDIFPARAMAVPKVEGAMAIEKPPSHRRNTTTPSSRRTEDSLVVVIMSVCASTG